MSFFNAKPKETEFRYRDCNCYWMDAEESFLIMDGFIKVGNASNKTDCKRVIDQYLAKFEER